MSFVDVPHRGLDAERREGARAAHPEHDLLLEAGCRVAAVQAMRDVAVAVGRALHRGVEKIQRDVADLRAPHARTHDARRERHFDDELRAVGERRRLDRQVIERRLHVVGALIAFEIDGLDEVALSIQETHRNERQAPIARRLAVIACEDAEAARVDRQALVDAELRAEVGGELAVLLPGAGRRRAERLLHVRVEGRQHPVEVVEEHRVGRRAGEPRLVDALQHRLGVVAHRVPERRMQPREERARRPVERVPQVAR